MSVSANSKQGPAAAQARRPEVLCIEDNPLNLALIANTLGRHGDVDVLTATEGTVGTRIAREKNPNLVLLDLSLPDICGEQALARLKADPATRHIPVVIVSADSRPGQVQRLLARGAHAYLTKPIDVAELARVTDQMMLGPASRAA